MNIIKNQKYSFENTIIVRAKEEGFNNVFIGEGSWYSIKILKERIPFLKYIAVYQVSPISQITHYAKIDSIMECPYEENK